MRIGWLLVIGLVALGCTKTIPDAQDTRGVSIWAASSARGVIDELDDEFESQKGTDVEIVPGGSNDLARQIVEGAKADLFLSADKEMADHVASKGLVAKRKNLLTNRLVVITNWDSPVMVKQLSDLTAKEVRRLAIADPKVPAGVYARQALKKAGVLDEVLKKSIGGGDVLAILDRVATNQADAGIVYWTDTLGNTKVQVAYEIPASMYEPIVYPLVLLKQGANRQRVLEFYDYLSSPQAVEKYRAAGFGASETELNYYPE